MENTNIIKKRKNLKTVLKALNLKRAFKLICGASLTETDKIEKLSMLFSLAGADIIDISSDLRAIKAATIGIDKAMKLYDPVDPLYKNFRNSVLMISINLGDDPHFKTAKINYDLCNNCGLCVNSCCFNAIRFNDDSSNVIINEDTCYGCGNCIKICLNKALYLKDNQVNLNTLLTKLISTSIAGIEIHVGSATEEKLQEFWDNIVSILGNDYIKSILLSFSLESSNYKAKELVEFTKYVINMVPQKVIIQVDGTPMSGNNALSSNLQSLAASQVLLRNNINAYIMPSGGINQWTGSLLRDFNLECNGIAMGTYARKLLWGYLDRLDQKEVLERAIRIATNLVDSLEF